MWIKVCWLVCMLVVATLTTAQVDDDGYTDENRPYKFGFNIQGHQHRKEQKDEKGIITGEYGFITADGYYRVTVYKTDEDGDFKIVSMKNYYVGFPPEDPTTTPAVPTRSNPPAARRLPSRNENVFSTSTTTAEPTTTKSTPTTTVNPVTLPVRGPMGCSSCFLPPKPPPQQVNLPAAGPGGVKVPSLQENLNGQSRPPFGNQNDFGTRSQKPMIPSKPITAELEPNSRFGGPNLRNNPNPRINEQIKTFEVNPPIRPVSQNNYAGQIPKLSTVKPELLRSSTEKSTTNEEVGARQVHAKNSLQSNKNFDNNNTKNLLQSNRNFDKNNAKNSLQSNRNFDNNRKLPGLLSFSNNEENRPKTNFPLAKAEQANGEENKLLYRFNYTVGFHGHHEDGYKTGLKAGDYFVNSRDGKSRKVQYIANEFGYQPNITFDDLDQDDERVPKEDTEKNYGLKGYEFKWFYRK